MIFNLLSIFVIAASSYFFQGHTLPLIAGLSIGTILFIVLGEKPKFEQQLDNLGIPGREAFAPIATLLLAIGMKAIDVSTVFQAFESKYEILMLILSFAVISNGLSRGGFFEFAAYKIVEKCGGDTRRLILYMFILASLLTFVTSNDIVVLTLTPIIYAICINARIHNAKLLLLSQFVAANTLAMGLMIGSPTNIILSDYFNLDFIGYFVIMIVPAVASFFLSLVVVEFINSRSQVDYKGRIHFFKLGWHYSDGYRVPARVPWSEFTPSMGRWMYLFIGAVIALMFVSNVGASLLWISIPLILSSALLMGYELAVDENYTELVRSDKLKVWFQTVLSLPYGILFFATTFFVFSSVIAADPSLKNFIADLFAFLKQHPVAAGPFSTVGSGLLVNVLNDLPASALIGEVFKPHINLNPGQGVKDFAVSYTLVQGILVGINIGCYLTPVGALAGLIWFSQIRMQERRQREIHQDRVKKGLAYGEFVPLIVPERHDLVIYGALHFFFTAILVGLFIPFSSLLLDTFALPTAKLNEGLRSHFGVNDWITICVGILVILFIFVRANSITKKYKLAFGHMTEIFTILNRVASWSLRHPIFYIFLLFSMFMFISGGLVYWIEGISKARYGIVPGDGGQSVPENATQFFSWFLVYFGSSYEQNIFPQSLLGKTIAGLVPLVAIGAILYVVKFTSIDNLKQLRVSLGYGNIPNYRILIVNHQNRFEKSVKLMLAKPGSFCVLVCQPDQFERAKQFSESLIDDPNLANRVLPVEIYEDTYALLRDLDFSGASEIYFLSDLRSSTDIDNMRMLTRIDAWLNTERVAAAEEVAAMEGLSQDTPETTSRGDFLGIPKVFFEASSQRQLDRVHSSLSDLLKYHTVVTAFDDVVDDILMGNIFGDANHLNARLGFGNTVISQQDEVLLESRETPFSHYRVFDLDASPEGKSRLQKFYGDHLKKEFISKRTIKHNSAMLRSNVSELISSILLHEHSEEKQSIAVTDIIGIKSRVGHRAFRISTGNAVVSAQTATADGLVVLDRSRGEDAQGQEITRQDFDLKSLGKQTIYLFNFNAYSDSFIRRLSCCIDIGQIEVVILINEHVNIPDDVSSADFVRIFRYKTVEEAVGLLAPKRSHRNSTSEQYGSVDTREEVVSIKTGETVIVFTDYENEKKSNDEVVKFIEGLDNRITGTDNLGIGAPQRDILLMLECNNEETRFLFEHYSVDKIIDTSRLRRTYLEQATTFFHGSFSRMHDADYAGYMGYAQWGQFHPTMYNFRRAFQFSDMFKPFVVELSDQFALNSGGGAKIPVVGLKVEKLIEILQSFSEPPLEFVGIFKLKPKRFNMKIHNEFGSGTTIENVDFDLAYVVERNDLIVMLPLL